MPNIKEVVDEGKIYNILEKTKNPNEAVVDSILSRALEKKGLSLEEAGYLINVEDPLVIKKIFKAAGQVKDEIYGERLVFFAPLYLSSYCVNDCKYCGFRVSNEEPRKKLTQEEIKKQVEILIDMGHKRLLLEFGEHPQNSHIDYVLDSIKTVYSVNKKGNNIRRVNINLAPTSVENYKKLKDIGIGTYQLFQETYHRKTYDYLHSGPKADYERQLFAHDKAFEAGIDDVGLGVLFGLYDYRFEILALLSHSQYLEKKFGVGPHTISVPRWQNAKGTDFSPNFPVSPEELLKIIAVLRLAVPYTGMIISTRESPETRSKAFKLGISQTSAASRTSPGGYGDKDGLNQFTLNDHRSLHEVIKSILEQGLLPSFCTACYRQGRTGEDFMKIAKPGDIHLLCRPNALLTFKEYLVDYAPEDIKPLANKILMKYLKLIPDENVKNETIKRLLRIEAGERDLYF